MRNPNINKYKKLQNHIKKIEKKQSKLIKTQFKITISSSHRYRNKLIKNFFQNFNFDEEKEFYVKNNLIKLLF